MLAFSYVCKYSNILDIYDKHTWSLWLCIKFFYFYLPDATIYASHSWSTVMFYVNLFCCVIVCFILTIQKRTILGLQELYHELQILDRMEHECQRREGSAAANQRGYFSILFSVISYVVN